MGFSALKALLPLVIKCWEFAPTKLLVVFILMLLSSITSGFGILMIVPLLASVGVDVGGVNAASGIAASINSWAASVGVSLNLTTVLLVYLLIMVVLASITYLNSTLSVSLRSGFTVHLRDQMARSLFFTQWQYLNRNHMSDFMRLILGQVQSTSFALYNLLSLLSGLILVSVYIVFSMMLSAKLTLIALGCGLGLVAILWPVNKRIHQSGGVGLAASRDMHRAVFENLASLKIIKSYAAEERYLQKIHRSNEDLELQNIRITKIQAAVRLISMVGAAFIFTLLFYSAIQWLHLPVANLLVILFIFSRLMPQISSLQTTLQSLIHQAPAYQDLMQRQDELISWGEATGGEVQAPILKNNIELRSLDYQYPETDKPIFNGLNAIIPAYKTTAIVGPSGVGKSTMVDIVAGLVAPSLGEVLIDGTSLNDANRITWRRQVAYVTQDVFLFHESVLENLLWVCSSQQFNSNEEQEQAVWRALELAAADTFVRELPQGLNTLIGDRGVKLSGGERQRLALARAILSEPQLLILDEATSALDRDNELKIRDALLNLDGKLTIIVIAHNETTIDHVSNKISLANNRNN